MWPNGQTAFRGLYYQPVFVDVSLGADTYAQLTGPTLSGPALTQLNRNLLRDAYSVYTPGTPPTVTYWYTEAPLQPDTVQAILAFDPLVQAKVTAFDTDMQRDLNALIYGPSIWDGNPNPPYNTTLFAPYVSSFSAELVALIAASPSPGTAQCVRMNRLLLEAGYTKELSKSVLAAFILVNAPASTTQLSAKTAWNLRDTSTGLTYDVNNNITKYFVNAGEEGAGTGMNWIPGTDHYLRGGDTSGDNVVSFFDYASMLTDYNSTASRSDINGDGLVNILDYGLLKGNWFKSGANEVQ